MGQSASAIMLDVSAGKFGPFAGQFFIGDYTLSLVMRAEMEKVNGAYQGACFPFRSAFGSGNLAMKFAADGSVLDMPNCPDIALRQRLRANCYPVREAGGIVWVWLGADDKDAVEPQFPDFEFTHLGA